MDIWNRCDRLRAIEQALLTAQYVLSFNSHHNTESLYIAIYHDMVLAGDTQPFEGRGNKGRGWEERRCGRVGYGESRGGEPRGGKWR